MSARALEVAPGVAVVTLQFVNAVTIDAPDVAPGSFVLVDTGLARHKDRILDAARLRYGPYARAAAIVLTHLHVDHAGSAGALAAHWDTPIYVGPRELPFAHGDEHYAEIDLRAGGPLAFAARFLDLTPPTLPGAIRLPADGTVPALCDWRWIGTPGHTPGQVSLWREADRVLVAGDALATVDADSWFGAVRRAKGLFMPPRATTPDRSTARASVGAIRELAPDTLIPGHGKPLDGLALRRSFDRCVAI